jgi:hypothetical protein
MIKTPSWLVTVMQIGLEVLMIEKILQEVVSSWEIT